jgi:hypothetical protein
MKHFKGTIVLFLIVCIALAMAASLFTVAADARADFEKWSNRSARVLEPADYNTKGTCSEAICSWKGVQGVGNMGIGDGNVSLMKPDVINQLVADSMPSAKADSNPGDEGNASGNRTGDIIKAPEANTAGNGTLVTESPGPLPAEPEPKEDGPQTESLYPDYDLAASIIPRGMPYTITINKPFEHILNEDPSEAAALYAKMIGIQMHNGQVVDLGIKSIGYEY